MKGPFKPLFNQPWHCRRVATCLPTPDLVPTAPSGQPREQCYDRRVMASEELRLDQLKVLVMGAADAVAEAIGRSLAAAGANLALTTATPHPDQAFSLQRLAKRISRPDHPIQTESIDMANGANVQIAIRKQTKDLGGLDLLIAAPEFHLPLAAERMNDADWTKVINTNLSGVFYACRGAAREMGRNDPPGGSLILVTTPINEPAQSQEAAFAAAQAGAVVLIQTLAQEWQQKNIRVNLVAKPADPGFAAATAAAVLEIATSSTTTGKIVSLGDRQ